MKLAQNFKTQTFNFKRRNFQRNEKKSFNARIILRDQKEFIFEYFNLDPNYDANDEDEDFSVFNSEP